MAPKPLDDLRAYVEQVQSEHEHPGERDRALAVVEGGVTDLLGAVKGYRNDAQLQAQGADERDDGETGGGEGQEATPPPKTSESS